MTRGISQRTERFTESVIREMTRLIQLHHPEGGLNLAQGFPDFPAPQALKDAACAAIQADINQYVVTWGAPGLRQAIGGKYQRFYGMGVDPEREITVCCGATEAMLATLMATVNPGEEVIVIAPFYENYWPDTVLAGATPRFVHLREPELVLDPEEATDGWRLDLDELAAAFNERTAAIVINTPNNPTGKVLTYAELEVIAALCQQWDTLAITDEIYEHIVYTGQHVPLATLPGMRERTVTISGASKTYSVTGWRVGWAIAPPRITNAIRKVHDFLTVGAAAPLQAAVAVALELPDDYYDQLARDYAEKRRVLLSALSETGFAYAPPDGAYYVMADSTPFGFESDAALARHLVIEHGLAIVPGSSFYPTGPTGSATGQRVRFSFPKKLVTLRAAGDRLAAFAATRRRR